jgi:hypothetical protein
MIIFDAIDFKNIRSKIPTSPPFISFIITSWHFDNLIAFLLSNNLKNGIVFVRPQSNIKNQTKYRLSKENFIGYEYLFETVYFLHNPHIKLKFLSALRYFYCSFHNSIYLIVPSTRVSVRIISSLLYLKLSLNNVIIDEGLGCYLPYNNFISYGNTGRIKRIINSFIYSILKKIIVDRYCNSIHDFCFFYSNSENKLLCNNIVSSALKSIYIKRYHEMCLNHTNDENTILILKDFNIVNADIDLIIYSNLFEYLTNKNCRIYIKKHPNDINLKFDSFVEGYSNVKLIDSGKSAEELIPIYTPKLLIGGYTTALFSSANIFEIKSISFMMIYLNYAGVNEIIKENISFFKRKFEYNDYLTFPSSYNELFQMLNTYNFIS